jgi:hypothetical protein
MPQEFTIPIPLRPDQEQVLEAYDPTSQLGLVAVVQQGPLAEIPDLVQRMQRVSEERLATQLQRPDATNFRQISLRQIVVNGHATAEWIYTATDATGGQPVDITVSYYIVKVGENYVYLTFSVPAAQYAGTRPAIEPNSFPLAAARPPPQAAARQKLTLPEDVSILDHRKAANDTRDHKLCFNLLLVFLGIWLPIPRRRAMTPQVGWMIASIALLFLIVLVFMAYIFAYAHCLWGQ